MSTFSVSIQIVGPDGTNPETIDALVDTGATFSVVPAPLLDRLGIGRIDRDQFELADGTIVENDVGEALFVIAGRRRTSQVVFGEPGEPVLLGAVTLESLLLGVDPIHHRLIPIPGLRYSARAQYHQNQPGAPS